MLLFNLIIFLSAFLLFQLELIIAKIFLPNFGGSYLVWGSCVLFFQAALLFGYVYSHLVIKQFGIIRYRLYHLFLVLFPLLFFPGRSIIIGRPHSGGMLSMSVFWQLLITIGPVFFVLSTASIVLQSWLSSSRLPQKTNPYALYGVSNLGSFGALLTYPFLFEVNFTIDQQLLFWRMIYFFIIVLYALSLRLVKVDYEEVRMQAAPSKIKTNDYLYWMVLSSAGVVLFLSVNNIITMELLPIPLLWIVPLSIYLLTFVFNFKQKTWCPAWIVNKINLILGLSFVLYFLMLRRDFPISYMLLLFCLDLFFLCMYCQNRLFKSKPEDHLNLTKFYVAISFGGFIGGFVSSWIMPVVSTTFLEFFLGLVLLALAILLKAKKEKVSTYNWILVALLPVVLFYSPSLIKDHLILGIFFLCLVFLILFSKLFKCKLVFFVSLMLILFITPFVESKWTDKEYIFRKRNYYGVLQVYDLTGARFFSHGTTAHGAQLHREEAKQEPLLYFSRTSPIGTLLENDVFQFDRIGVLGLGIGTLASYLNGDQTIDFFELDPDVLDVAHNYFTYIDKNNKNINVILGDGRQSIQRSPDKHYDLIVMDAFNGDYIPTHLITVEAIQQARNKIKADGILLFHISNRYLSMGQVVSRTGHAVSAKVCLKLGDKDNLSTSSTWLAMTWDDDVYQKLITEAKWIAIKEEMVSSWRPWTDGYSSIIPILWDTYLYRLKNK